MKRDADLSENGNTQAPEIQIDPVGLPQRADLLLRWAIMHQVEVMPSIIPIEQNKAIMVPGF